MTYFHCTMLQQILTAYRLSSEDSTIELINNGLINRTWLVKNHRGAFIVQKINTVVFRNPRAIASNLRLLNNYLTQHAPSYLFVAPLLTSDGEEMVFIENEGYFRAFPYVPHSHTVSTVKEPRQAYEAARMFGKFTRLLSSFPVSGLQTTIPDFHNLSLRYRQFSMAVKTGNPQRIVAAADLIDFIIVHKNIVETYEKILPGTAFQLRVTHHDTKISNVLFDPDDLGLCIIDLDTVMPGYFISDVGDMMRTYLSPASEEERDFASIHIRAEYFSAIWKGYMSEMKNELSQEEKDHFIYSGKFMIYMQAIRFLTDFVQNDVYYGSSYEEHNLIRAGNQVRLLQQLMETEPALLRMMKES